MDKIASGGHLPPLPRSDSESSLGESLGLNSALEGSTTPKDSPKQSRIKKMFERLPSAPQIKRQKVAQEGPIAIVPIAAPKRGIKTKLAKIGKAFKKLGQIDIKAALQKTTTKTAETTKRESAAATRKMPADLRRKDNWTDETVLEYQNELLEAATRQMSRETASGLITLATCRKNGHTEQAIAALNEAFRRQTTSTFLQLEPAKAAESFPNITESVWSPIQKMLGDKDLEAPFSELLKTYRAASDEGKKEIEEAVNKFMAAARKELMSMLPQILERLEFEG